jgi:hypothetical protein
MELSCHARMNVEIALPTSVLRFPTPIRNTERSIFPSFPFVFSYPSRHPDSERTTCYTVNSCFFLLFITNQSLLCQFDFGFITPALLLISLYAPFSLLLPVFLRDQTSGRKTKPLPDCMELSCHARMNVEIALPTSVRRFPTPIRNTERSLFSSFPFVFSYPSRHPDSGRATCHTVNSCFFLLSITNLSFLYRFDFSYFTPALLFQILNVRILPFLIYTVMHISKKVEKTAMTGVEPTLRGRTSKGLTECARRGFGFFFFFFFNPFTSSSRDPDSGRATCHTVNSCFFLLSITNQSLLCQFDFGFITPALLLIPLYAPFSLPFPLFFPIRAGIRIVGGQLATLSIRVFFCCPSLNKVFCTNLNADFLLRYSCPKH